MSSKGSVNGDRKPPSPFEQDAHLVRPKKQPKGYKTELGSAKEVRKNVVDRVQQLTNRIAFLKAEESKAEQNIRKIKQRTDKMRLNDGASEVGSVLGDDAASECGSISSRLSVSSRRSTMSAMSTFSGRSRRSSLSSLAEPAPAYRPSTAGLPRLAAYHIDASSIKSLATGEVRRPGTAQPLHTLAEDCSTSDLEGAGGSSTPGRPSPTVQAWVQGLQSTSHGDYAHLDEGDRPVVTVGGAGCWAMEGEATLGSAGRQYEGCAGSGGHIDGGGGEMLLTDMHDDDAVNLADPPEDCPIRVTETGSGAWI